jgi:hypothetical protein
MKHRPPVPIDSDYRFVSSDVFLEGSSVTFAAL